MKRRRFFAVTVSCVILITCFCSISAFAAKTIESESGDWQATIYDAEETIPETVQSQQGKITKYDYTICDADGTVVETGVYDTEASAMTRATGGPFVLANGQSVTFTPQGDARGFLISKGTHYEIRFRVNPKARMFFRAAYSEPVPKTLFEHTSTTTAYIVSGHAEDTGYVRLFAQNISANTVTLTEIAFDF